MRKRTYLILLLLLIIDSTLADNIKLKYLTIEEGLSNNYVVSITQDKKGFVWIATEYGLNRFDGKNFKHFTKRSDGYFATISGNELNKLFYDEEDDILWIATQREGLNSFDCTTETFQEFKHTIDSNTIIGNDITHISGATNGNLWLSSYYNGVDHYDKEEKKFTHYNQSTLPNLISNKVWTVEEDKEHGLLFIGHVNEGLSVVSLKTKSIETYAYDPLDENSLPGNDVRSILIDSNNNVWIGTNNGLALYNPIKKNFTNFNYNKQNESSLAGNLIYSIKELSDKRIFIATEGGGVSILDPVMNMFSSPDSVNFVRIKEGIENKELNNRTVRDIFQDSFGNIWLGTYGNGINLIAHSPLHFNTWEYSPLIDKKDRLNNKVAWGICADLEDNLWIGTDGGGINYFEKGEIKKIFRKETHNLVDNAFLAAMKDNDGNLWFGAYQNGISIYNSNLNKFEEISLPKDVDVRCFFEDNNNNIFIGTSNGFYIYNQESRDIQNFNIDNSPLLENQIRAISQDKDGNLWIGTFGRGLFLINNKMELIMHFDANKDFYSNTVNYIYKDSKDKMWVATGEGLVYFPNNDNISNFSILTEKNGLLNSHIRAITEDSKNDIWVSSNSGISRLVQSTNRIYNYDHTAGVPIGDFMSGSVTKTSDGTIYFGSQNGICFFDPLDIPTNLSMSSITLTGITIYSTDKESINHSEDIPIQTQLSLPYHKNTLKVTFNNLNITQNPMSEYAYYLEGANNSWINTLGENNVTFRDLSHGKYELKLKARLLNQDWSDEVVTLQITINPPIWLTWWAKLFYILLLFITIIVISRFYKKRLDLENTLILEKKNHLQEQYINNERLRFFTNITHELKTPLTLILGPLNDMSNDDGLSSKQRIRINRIEANGKRLYELINQLLEFRKVETENRKLHISKGDLATLVSDIGLKYKELNINKNIIINTHIESKETVLLFDSQIITIVLDNLISNSIKHTKRGEINIILRDSLYNNIDYIEIEVNDTGSGIPKELHERIFERYFQIDKDKEISGTGIGLSLVKSLTKIHDGTISVTSAEKKGTSFLFRIEKDNLYPDAIHIEETIEINDDSFYKKNSNGNIEKTIILVVEDNEEIRLYIKETLSDYYEVITAENGEIGYELALKFYPVLIISDIMMPVMDGIELCKKIKKDLRTSHIPIILLTAKDTNDDRTVGYETGADSYIVKPFSSSLLHSRINNILEARKKIAHLIKNNKALKTEIMSESISQVDEIFLDDLISIIEDNIDSDILTVKFIAEQMNMSHSTLYRKVKALSEMTVNEFIRKIKMQKAEKLLLEGKYNISEVSYMIGINSATYFRESFKDEFGLLPSEYIKHILNND